MKHAPPLLAALLLACVAAVAAALQPAEPRADPVPTLDELLGLEDPAPPSPAPDPARTQLEERLSAEQIGETLERAVSLMGQTAARLTDAADPGIVTQRLQEDTLALLDKAIAAAQQNQQQGSPSSASSQQQQQQQQQPSQPQPAPGSQAQAGEPDDANMPPGATGVNARPGQAAAGAAWGALPERLRGSLMQGLADRYSSIYERATESYYRRLAEEERP